jgi:hypothetical protein
MWACIMWMTAAVLLIGILLMACASPARIPSAAAETARTSSSARASPTSSVIATANLAATASPITPADAAACPVTKPIAAPPEIGDRLFGSEVAFGNSDLWVGGLGTDGLIPADDRFVESDGSIGWKFGWWRIASGVLTITGQRLDGPAPPVRASVPDGYGSEGFQASGVNFPTEGCWQVSGRVGGAELTFVTFVLRF